MASHLEVAHPRVIPAKTLRAAIDQAPDSIVIADTMGRIVYANAAIEQHIGRPAADLVGRHFVVALKEGDHAAAYDSVSLAVSQGQTWSGARTIRTLDGLHVVVDLVVAPIRDRSGVVTGVLSIGRRGKPKAPAPELTAWHARDGGDSVVLSAIPDLRAELEGIIRDRSFRSIFQPIITLSDGAILGYEGLTRFDDGSTAESRFVQATATGLGIELEVVTLEAVLAAARELPKGGFLSVNVSPALVLERTRLEQALVAAPCPIVLEITEREQVEDYTALRAAIARIAAPLRWAIDDAGAGYASLRHIIELRPQFVKLDRGLISGIALDPIRQALVAGLLHFSSAIATTLIAEGIETEPERLALQALGVSTGQGYLFGMPEAPLRE